MLVNSEGWHIDSYVDTGLAEYCNKFDGIWEEQYALGRARAKGSNVHKAFKLVLATDIYNVLSKSLILDNYKIFGAYLLNYSAGSFTALHRDNEEQSHKTSITLIGQSDDLIGGEAILVEHTGAPAIAKQLVGQTMWYDQRLLHGVSKIEKGQRKVLVIWWENKGE